MKRFRKLLIGSVCLIALLVLTLTALIINQKIVLVDSTNIREFSRLNDKPIAYLLTLAEDELAYVDPKLLEQGTHLVADIPYMFYNLAPQLVSLRNKRVYAKDSESRTYAVNVTVGFQLKPSEIPFAIDTSAMRFRIWHIASENSQDILEDFSIEQAIPNDKQLICEQLKHEISKDIEEFGYQLTEFVLEDLQRGYFRTNTSPMTPLGDIIFIKQKC